MCPAESPEAGTRKNTHIRSLQHFVKEQIQSKVITCYMSCHDHIEVTFLGFLPVLFAQVHSDKRVHAGSREASDQFP